MAMLIQCECGQTMRVKASAAGKLIRCQNLECSKRHRVPRETPNQLKKNQPDQSINAPRSDNDSDDVDWDNAAQLEREAEVVVEEPELPATLNAGKPTPGNRRIPKGFPLMVKGCQILLPKGLPATRKCPKCGERLWHHIHVGSLSWVGADWVDRDGEETQGELDEKWGWKQSWVCLRCYSVDCMRMGCNQRACIGFEHHFEVGDSSSHLDKSFHTTFRNDVWCCERHGHKLKSHILQKNIGVLAFLCGLLGCIVAFTSKSIVGGIVAALVMAPGLYFWLTHAIALRPSHFPKKSDYILRVAPPTFAESDTSVFQDDSFV